MSDDFCLDGPCYRGRVGVGVGEAGEEVGTGWVVMTRRGKKLGEGGGATGSRIYILEGVYRLDFPSGSEGEGKLFV